MTRVVIVGAGPAGLAAAERLLVGGGVDVTVITADDFLGGRAGSWEGPDGLVLERGQHITMGFYEQMPALIERAGVDFMATSTGNEGHYTVWEDRDESTHHLHLGPSATGTLWDSLRYTGWTLSEKLAFAAFLARVIPRVLRGVPEEWDDVCLSAWCLERGLPVSVLETNGARAARDSQLNWPGEISAYSMLKAIARAGRDYTTGHARFPGGGMSELWWEPVGRRVEALGGRIERRWVMERIVHQAGRLSGVVLARGGERRFRAADAAIVAIPPLALATVLDRDPVLGGMPGLSGCGRLRPIAPLGLHVWHRLPTRPRHRTVVFGIPHPLEFAVDNKPFYAEYRDRPDIGSALHFVGQETGFEDRTDTEHLAAALTALRRVEGYEHLDDDGILAWQLVRSREAMHRYWNGEPGSLRFKPRPRAPLPGLYVAGDWVRSDFDFPCMEAAVCSGREAARLLARDRLRRPDRVAEKVVGP